MADQVRRGDVFLWCEPGGAPCSMAWRVGETPSGGRIGCVYTPAALRGRGYAQAATAGASRKILDGGKRACYLIASAADAAANRAYERVGYRPVASSVEMSFTPRG